ncbi:Transmembrane matrix receptor MUP-4, partial [Trichinella sp. T9]
SAQYHDNSAWSPATQHNSHGWSAQNCSAYYTTTSPSPLSHVCQNWNSQASNPFEKFFGPIPGVVRPEFRVPCNVKDPLACNASLFEVCTFNQGAYGCTCPPNFSRLPDGRCKVANECYEPSMNDCSHNAICIDEIESYRCQCKPGFTDVSPDPSRMPGRVCLQVEDQCSHPAHYNIDCDKHATCQNTPHGFTCVCNPGYVDTSELVNLKPGRRCSKEVNECANPSMNDCSPNATCIDTKEGYTCRCKPGYIDVSMNVGCYPGRECRLPTETSASERQCDPRDSKSCPNGEICEFSGGLYRCTCPNNAARLENGQCATAKNCQTEKVDCDPNADCINLVNGYTCQCNSGFRDVSPDPVKKPGRKCSQLINECAIPWMNKCSPFAECIDTPESYLCQCKHGYVDVSSTYGLPPGRQCSNTTKMCARPETNSCDPEAVCIDKPDGYICVCPEGYVDVSSNAKLQPGRVCTLQTLCPTQPTDLVFLIDGSGSIGTEIFYKYVMRFVHEFVTLFDINEDRTRVGIIQYTGQVKPEFYLNQHKNIDQLQQAIRNIRYVGGLTKTGAALQFMTKNTFTAQMGARTRDPNVYKIGVVITDGRAQDNVKIPADEARRHNISLYAVGVTNHVLESELEQIAGSKDRYFIVGTFAELNTRLRAKIQKEMCKGIVKASTKTVLKKYPGTYLESDVASLPPSRSCAVPENEVQNPCDRTLNQVCIQGKCGCGYGFCKNLKTGECGFSSCNPELPTSCPFPTVCKKTIYGDARCACPDDHICHPSENTCVKVSHSYQCSANEDYNYATGKCEPKGSFCKPICDPRKKEVCLRNRYDPSKMSCQCPEKHLRDPNTGICTVDECAHQLHDCSPHATCTDTFDSYICSCLPGYIDKSRDPIREPGRICEKPLNPCESGRHNCSPDALCFPTATGGFTCQCRDGYLDMSPNLKQSPGLVCKKKVNECADPSLNNCSENAECTDTDTGYLCHCKPGYRDISPLQSPGRKCVPDVCQSPDKNDCWQGRCRTTDAEKGQYTCEPCPSGYMDKSPNPNLPGRLCVPSMLIALKKSPCSDPSRNDCSHYAWCLEVGEENYSCKCRDGFDDVSPNPSQYPGRVCEPATDPCRDNRMNDCDPHALCEKSGRSYTCTCKTGYLDTSPDKARAPGRQCTQLVNECENFQMNNCSRYAKCIDKEIGYTCECLEGYHDTNPQSPGRECSLVINECESYNLNDCHPNAICTDLLVGYSCKCKPPYVDHSPDPQKPGRICKYNECSDPNLNDCDPNAECQDTESSYVCFCKEGYKDMDPSRPGRNCLQISTPPPVTTEAPCDIQCGTKLCCSNRGEVCLRGQCSCPPGFGRANSYDNCRPVDTVTIPVIVNRLGESPLVWSSTFSDSDHPRFVEISDLFSKGVGEALSSTDVEPAYINTQVLEIKNAHHINSKLPEGLLVDASIQMQRGGPPAEVVCRQLQASIKNAGDIIGKTQLHTPESFDICRPIIPKQMPPSCGGLTCKEDLGEVCIGEQICACPYGKGRHDPHDHCQDVVAINLPLLIKRKGHQTLQFNNAYGDTSSPEYQNIVNTFTDGIKRAFARTAIYPQYTGNEVRDIRDPRTMNSTWNDGLWFEFTTYFLKGYEPSPSEAYNHLLGSILETHYSVGGTDLYINEYQPPFACYQHTCDSRSIIIDRGDGVCACKCPEGYVDRNVVHPGTKCVPMIVTTPRITTPFPNCGDNYCYSSLGEICHNGECVCPPGMSRRLEGQPCIQVDTFTIPIVVDRWASMPLQWSTVYEHPDDSRFIEMHNVYLTAVGQAVKSLPETDSSTVSFTVDQINDPSKTYPNVGSGLLFNTTFAVSPGATDKEKFCNTFMQGIKESGYKIGSSQLHVDENVDPCKPPPKAKSELPCGNLVCKSSLGEVCIGNRLCACPFGFGRKHENDPCIETIPISLPLWVIRRNQDPLYFGKNYSDSNSPLRKEVVDMFETGVKRAYDRTPLNNNFLDVAVRDISNPSSVNSTFGKGLWFDFIVHFTPAPSLTAQEAHTQLLDSIRGTAYSIGGTELYINEWQPSIACYKNDCFKGGICIPLADGGYTCKCPENYEDKQPRNPGRQCSILVNPCSDPALNNCDPNAECVFLSNGQYRCECKAGFSEPHGFIGMKGTNCVYDLCVDLPFCKEKNATCVNYGDRADCQCLDGYLDIRKSPINVRAQFGLDDVFCLKPQDVDRCALGLHNCIPPAVCIGGRGDSPQCRCPDGTMIYEGVLCQEKLDSCAECNYHGDCVFKDNQTYCQCHDWYTGEKCTTDVRIILVIIFAIIFFLLTLLCCLYFCLKCHFIRNRGLVYREMGGSSGSEGLSAGYGRESDFYTDFSIPRAKLKDHPMKGYAAEASPDRRMMQYLDSAGQHAGDEQLGSETIAFSDVLQGIPRRGAGYRDDMSESEYSSGSYQEEIQRRVTKDTKRTITTKTIHGAGNTKAVFNVYPPENIEEGKASESQAAMKTFSSQKCITNAFDDEQDFSSTEYDEGESETSSQCVLGETFDTKTSAKQTHQVVPDADGYGGVERFISQTSTTTKSKHTQQH